MLRGHWKAPALLPIQDVLATLDPKQHKAVRQCVVEVADSAMHDFLFALRQRADFEGDIQLLVDGQDVVGLSDGIHGEAFGPDGWQARFSQFIE